MTELDIIEVRGNVVSYRKEGVWHHGERKKSS